MTPIATSLVKVVKEKGWMAISGVFFDGTSSCDVFNTAGNLAISEETESMYWFTILDSGDTNKVEGRQIMSDNTHLGHMIQLTQNGLEQVFHVGYALYNYPFYYDVKDDEAFPYPKYPTEAELKKCTYNEKTGLYDGVKRYCCQTYPDSGREIPNTRGSVIPLYEDFDPNMEKMTASIRVEYWKKFYENHEKFTKMLENYLGLKNLI